MGATLCRSVTIRALTQPTREPRLGWARPRTGIWAAVRQYDARQFVALTLDVGVRQYVALTLHVGARLSVTANLGARIAGR